VSTIEREEPGRPGPGALARLRAGLTAAPPYVASAAERRTVTLAGLELPFRATVVLALVTIIQILDYSETFQPPEYHALPWGFEVLRYLAIERLVAFGVVPFLVVTLAFRESPRRYGLGLGDWRWGLGLATAGTLVMLPIVLAVVRLPDFAIYYAPLAAPLTELVPVVVADLVTAEFLYRGFLMFTLVRTIGPIGVLVAQLPFAFAHLGKPDLEVLSTLAGGLAYGWLAWRTGSIWWGAAAHVVIYTTAILAAGAVL
jgi:membrane protease YdiL (CAAX protease family)